MHRRRTIVELRLGPGGRGRHPRREGEGAATGVSALLFFGRIAGNRAGDAGEGRRVCLVYAMPSCFESFRKAKRDSQLVPHSPPPGMQRKYCVVSDRTSQSLCRPHRDA